MPLTLPNLADRTYTDLVEEARGLLVANAPDLTNHNPSDPLITMVELFAHFTEVLLFRLNVVTDANRIAFLRLLNGPDPPDETNPPPEPKPPPTHEEIVAAIRSTVLELRKTDRAVTPADFEFLALTVPSAVRPARAHCVPGLDLSRTDPALRLLDSPGHVSVVIVPFHAADLAKAIQDVADYLEPRRLLTTRVHVVGPRYVPLTVHVTIHLLPDARKTDVKPRVLDALTARFDALTGGRDGTGWPFGRTVYVSEIYELLDGITGVDYVTRTASGGAQLDELEPAPDFADRKTRNADLELIGITLQPDELAMLQIDIDKDVVLVEHLT